MSTMRDAAMQSKAWPFEEARRVLKRVEQLGKSEALSVGPVNLADILRHIRHGWRLNDIIRRSVLKCREKDASSFFLHLGLRLASSFSLECDFCDLRVEGLVDKSASVKTLW